jgi:hypothetical protein
MYLVNAVVLSALGPSVPSDEVAEERLRAPEGIVPPA